jgi:hypothetical protein
MSVEKEKAVSLAAYGSVKEGEEAFSNLLVAAQRPLSVRPRAFIRWPVVLVHLFLWRQNLVLVLLQLIVVPAMGTERDQPILLGLGILFNALGHLR